MARVQVIGGGFSGLAAAYFLAKNGQQVRLVEKTSRLGGLLGTIATPFGLVETAANALLSSALVESVAADLGLTLVSALPSARRRFIYCAGQARRWPLGPWASLQLLGVFPRYLCSRSRAQLAPRPLENVQAWGERAMGKEALEHLVAPALSGIYAGDPRSLSASLVFGRYFSSKKKMPPGRHRGSVAPRTGMGAWAEGFRAALTKAGAEFTTQEAKEDLPTVVALPPPEAAVFLRESAPALAASLSEITMLPVLTATLFFPANTPCLEGFGCLFPRGEGFRALGVLANDRIFPERVSAGQRSETWILGGATDPGALQLSDAEIIELLQKERARLLGDKYFLLHSQLTRWERAIPHYDLKLEKLVRELRLRNFREGRFRLFGNYLGDLGLGRILQRAAELPKDFP